MPQQLLLDFETHVSPTQHFGMGVPESVPPNVADASPHRRRLEITSLATIFQSYTPSATRSGFIRVQFGPLCLAFSLPVTKHRLLTSSNQDCLRIDRLELIF